ncbi:MAG TPA: hypothetical protein VKN76_12200 [Kiloniellaceae bacterium]|nr:hypothetical protein [Kiloniellaceae bacterium]
MSGGLRALGAGAIGACAGIGHKGKLAVPVADVSRGAWTSVLAANLFEAINSQVYDDSDHATSSQNPLNDVFAVRLAEVTDPGVDFGHILKYRYRKVGSGRADITVKLKQADTVIATFSHSDIGSAYSLAEQRLSDAQAASITDYADLRVEVTANKS